MVKIGDKVRFLDAQGGGIVRSFKTKDLVMVEDEDGFEIPTLVGQCVVVSDEDDERAAGHVRPKQAPPRQLSDAALRGSQQHSDPRLRPAPATSAPAPLPADRPRTWEDTKHTAAPAAAERREGDVLNVELAFLPTDVRHLSSASDFECYLINDSNYELSYILLSDRDGAATLRCAGTIEPNTKERLFLIRRADLEDLEHCAIQLIAYKRGRPFAPQSPMHIDLRLNTARFYKLHAFVENDFFDQGALLQAVVRGGRPYLPMVVDEKAIAASIREKVAATQPKKAAPQRPQPAPSAPGTSKPHQDPAKMPPLEVDLHIHALLDTTAGMDASDMLNYQLSVFHKTMREHQQELGRRIVFIHGKGEGVLRKALLDELRRFYPACAWQDASFQQYGFGATQVTVHRK